MGGTEKCGGGGDYSSESRILGSTRGLGILAAFVGLAGWSGLRTSGLCVVGMVTHGPRLFLLFPSLKRGLREDSCDPIVLMFLMSFSREQNGTLALGKNPKYSSLSLLFCCLFSVFTSVR